MKKKIIYCVSLKNILFIVVYSRSIEQFYFNMFLTEKKYSLVDPNYTVYSRKNIDGLLLKIIYCVEINYQINCASFFFNYTLSQIIYCVDINCEINCAWFFFI